MPRDSAGPTGAGARPSSVLAVSRAMPTYVEIRGKNVLTSIVRTRSAGPLELTVSGAQGNQTAVHTEHLLAMPGEHYDYWAERFSVPRGTWPLTHWGENITLQGVLEEHLPIGATLHVGPSAILQVTSPRNPCFKLSWRLGLPDDILPQLLTTGRSGFYLRVVSPGPIHDGDDVRVLAPDEPAPTVADIARLMAGTDHDPDHLRTVLATPGLGVQCAGMLRQRLVAALDRDRTQAHRWPGWRRFEVLACRHVADGVRAFDLSPVGGPPLAGYRAGQHVRVRVGGPERPWVRAWSLSDYADQPGRYRISVKRSIRPAASAHMHDAVAIGSVVEVSAPAGSFQLDRTSNHPTILISAGIGMTPLLAMLKSYAGLGPGAPPLHWIHVTRNTATYAHRDEVDDLLQGRPNLRRHVRFTDPLVTDRPGVDYDAPGRLTPDALRATIAVYRYPIFGREVELPGAAAEFYVCGPAPFEADIRTMLTSMGASPNAIRSESFGVAMGAGGAPARIRFAHSGIEADWTPGASVLETAEEAGVVAPHDCRTGVCHECAVAILDGSVGYPREPLRAPEPGMALLCCSRPTSRVLVLAI